jgi:PPOX class probable F420-dependent enzyme
VPLPDDAKELASGANFATLTTLLPDGHPATQVMWVDTDGDHLIVNTEIHRRKYRNIQADPRVTVCIWEAGNPYTYAEVRGTVVDEVGGQRARDHIDECSQRYVGRPYDPDKITSERVMLFIAPRD